MICLLLAQYKKAKMLHTQFGFKWVDAWRLSLHFFPRFVNVKLLQNLDGFKLESHVCCGQNSWKLTSTYFPENGRILLKMNGMII